MPLSNYKFYGIWGNKNYTLLNGINKIYKFCTDVHKDLFTDCKLVKIYAVKAMLYLGVDINLYLYFPYVLFNPYEIQYKKHFSALKSLVKTDAGMAILFYGCQ